MDNKKERAGVIIETDYGVLLVKDRKKELTQRDPKSLRTLFDLPEQFHNLEFFNLCLYTLQHLQPLLESKSHQQITHIITQLFQDLDKFKNYQKIFNQLYERLPQIQNPQESSISNNIYQSEIEQFFFNYNDDQEPIENLGKQIDLRVNRLTSLLYMPNRDEREYHGVIQRAQYERKKSLVKIMTREGKFSLPGGSQKIDEAIVETAIREVEEEIQLRINKIQFLTNIYDQGRTHRIFVAQAQGHVELFKPEISGIGFLDADTPLPFNDNQKIPHLRSITQNHVRRVYQEYICDSTRDQFRTPDWISELEIEQPLIEIWNHDIASAQLLKDVNNNNEIHKKFNKHFKSTKKFKIVPKNTPSTRPPKMQAKYLDNEEHPILSYRLFKQSHS